MKVLNAEVLHACWDKHADSKSRLEAWFQEAAQAAWKNPHELKSRFPSADCIGNGRVVFDIGGNSYRLVVQLSYVTQIVVIRFAGTHAEYDAIDANSV